MSLPKTLITFGTLLGMAAVAALILVPALGDMGLTALRGGLTATVASLFLVVTGLVLKDAQGIKRGD